MRKLITLVALLGSVFIAQANDEAEFLRYDEDTTAQYELIKEAEETTALLLYKMECETPLKVFASAFECYPNTFVWYVWRDYDKGDVFQKIEALQTLNDLNR